MFDRRLFEIAPGFKPEHDARGGALPHRLERGLGPEWRPAERRGMGLPPTADSPFFMIDEAIDNP